MEKSGHWTSLHLTREPLGMIGIKEKAAGAVEESSLWNGSSHRRTSPVDMSGKNQIFILCWAIWGKYLYGRAMEHVPAVLCTVGEAAVACHYDGQCFLWGQPVVI
jgi:hypothetical protein